LGKRRGQLTMSVKRTEIIALVDEATRSGARQKKACDIVGISDRTFQRWNKPAIVEDGRLETKCEPANKLSPIERERVLTIANSSEYADLSPSKIVPKLADTGYYVASESTFYRILKEKNQMAHRQKSKPARQIKKPESLTARGPNQVYSWDITYLPTLVKGIFSYLYLVMDIYSRKIVGWQVYHEESSALAADLMTNICENEGLKKGQVTLHSDNGSPMKGATMLATLQNLGVIPSFSRPSVSDDNPYSESLFRTLKYRPEYPEQAFENLEATRIWVQGFVHWYNHEHLHSSIKFVTPEQRHNGEDTLILAKRKLVYQKAQSENPNRWTGSIRDWQPITEVHLNPGKEKTEIKENRAA
jgi:putative transposase